MWTRVLAVFRAGLQAQWRAGAWPAAPLLVHGTIAAVLCGLVSNELPAYAFALFSLSISAALIALPLLGEFGALLRADPAADWIEAQPVRRSELRHARTLLVALLVVALASAAMLPAAILAPDGMGLAGRAALFAAGIAQALAVAAVLLGLQSLLGERAESVLVLLQTLLVGGVIAGVITSLRLVPLLVGLEAPARTLAFFPPAWFAHLAAPSGSAAWSLAAILALILAGGVLALAPLPPASHARRAGGWLGAALRPARSLATRFWVRPGAERGVFDFVFDALPLERDFVLRTYPMLGIPLAFLALGARGEAGAARDGLLSLLLFTSATYLPIPIVYVQASASAGARWILDTSPATSSAVARGAIKALAVRFLLPLYAVLAGLCWALSGPGLALRLALPGALVSLIVMRRLYPRLVLEPPLSVAPDAVRAEMDWTGVLLGLALVLTVVAVIAVRAIDTPLAGFVVALGLAGIDHLFDRRTS